jgi:hypothetical protein
MHVLLALSLLGFGLACLNYTKASTIDHHIEWAAEEGMPAPSPGLFRAGIAGSVIGAFLLGGAGKRRKRR